MINLAKQKGGKFRITPDFAKTPIGKYMTNQGKGLVTVYQPSDDETSGGSAPPRNRPGIKPDIEAMTTPPGGHPGEIPFEPNSGGPKEHIKKAAKKGGLNKKDSSGGDPDKKAGVGQGGFFGDLPGPPELVNPNPVSRSPAKSKQPGAATMQLPSAGGGGRSSAPSSKALRGTLR